MRRLPLLMLAIIAVAGCSARSTATRPLPFRSSDEITTPADKPVPAGLPKVGDRLSDEQLQRFFQGEERGAYKVTLAVQSGSQEAYLQLGYGRMTIARDGKQAATTIGINSIYRTADGEFVACKKTASTAQCSYIDAAAATAATGGSLVGSTSNPVPGAIASRTRDRVILGRVTNCAYIDFAAGTEEGAIEICLDQNTGAPMLEVLDMGADSLVLEADELSTPNRNDFEPPAIPTR